MITMMMMEIYCSDSWNEEQTDSILQIERELQERNDYEER